VSPEDRPEKPEVGPGSLWLLRGITALTALIVLYFLIDAVRG
jgi:hypothetical protein